MYESGTLPAEVTGFVGRRREVAEVRRLLSSSRLVTLTGPGGIGKTRLALRVAAEVRRSFPDGVRLVELASLREGVALAPAVAAGLGLGKDSGSEPMDALKNLLADRRLLLVLDNCEHLTDACAALASELLAAAAGLQILATSRQVLAVPGELALPVPPLPVPDQDQMRRSGTMAGCEAVALFTERAATIRPDFVLTADNSRAVAEICRRLDGIPLAIELAAARLRALTVAEILHRLDDRFALLTQGCRAAPPHRQTLRATLDWSHELCSPKERLLWSRLSVFCDGFDLEAVEAVCSADGIADTEVLDLVAGLVDKSVLGCEERADRMRYRLLETLRHYGQERLTASGEEHALRERHRDWYKHLAEQAEADWFGPRQLQWCIRLRADHANMCSALEYCLTEPANARTALAMAASMWSHRLGSGPLAEGRRYLAQALALEPDPTPEKAKALCVDALLALLQGDTHAATTQLGRLHALPRELTGQPDLDRTGATLTGMTALFQGRFPEAMAGLKDVLERHEAEGDDASAATTSFLLTTACFNLDNPATGDYAKHCLALCEAHDASWSRTHAQWALAVDCYRRGNTPRATTLLRHALQDKPPGHDLHGIAQCLEVLGWCATAEGASERATTLLGAAQAAWERSGSALTGLGHLLAAHRLCEKRLRQDLGANAFAAAFQTGSRLTPDRAVHYALAQKQIPSTPPPVPETSAPLSRREQQVAALVSQGLSNKDIAAQLVISQRTAEGHVEHILTKLGFTSRTQIAAWAAAGGTD